MKKNEELFALIKAMSKSEKRNFRLESAQFKGSAKYIKLFDAIDSLDEYDEQQIKTLFKNDKSLRQFHVLKNYLKQAILKSLRSFHAKRSKQVELNDCLSNLNILFNKELFQLCEVEVKKAERIAVEYDLFSGLNEVQNWKRKLAQTKDPSNFSLFKQILQQQIDSVERLKNQHSYYQLITDLSESIIAGYKGPIPNEELLEDINNASSFESGVIHCNARYFKAVNLGNADETKECLNDLIAFFELHKNKLEQYPGLYISSMNNAISYFVFTVDYDTALKMIVQLQDFYDRIKLQKENITLLKQALRMYNLELEIYRQLQAESENKDKIESIHLTVEKAMNKMPDSYLISFWFQLANIYFVLEDFKTALKFLNKIMDNNFGDTRSDIQLHARILNLMVHFELNNLFVLRYFVESAKRMAKKVPYDQQFLKKLLSCFSKLGQLSPSDFKAVFTELKTLIANNDLITKEHINLSTGYINYNRWLEKRGIS